MTPVMALTQLPRAGGNELLLKLFIACHRGELRELGNDIVWSPKQNTRISFLAECDSVS